MNAPGYRDIALELSQTVEGLIYGLPDLLKAGDLKDEEGLIEKAAAVLDRTSFGLAHLDEDQVSLPLPPAEG